MSHFSIVARNGVLVVVVVVVLFCCVLVVWCICAWVCLSMCLSACMCMYAVHSVCCVMAFIPSSASGEVESVSRILLLSL